MKTKIEKDIEKDLVDLNLILVEGNTKLFRRHILRMLDKIKKTGVEEYYKRFMNDYCMSIYNKPYEYLFYTGLKRD